MAGIGEGWTEAMLSEREILLATCLQGVRNDLARVLRPGSCGPLIVLALERGMPLRQVTDLIEAMHRTISIALQETYPSGWRGAWRRFRTRSNPLAQGWREANLAMTLRDGIRMMKALGLEDWLAPDTLKLIEPDTVDPRGPKGK